MATHPFHKARLGQVLKPGWALDQAQQNRHGRLAEVVVARPQPGEALQARRIHADLLKRQQRAFADRVAGVVYLERKRAGEETERTNNGLNRQQRLPNKNIVSFPASHLRV